MTHLTQHLLLSGLLITAGTALAQTPTPPTPPDTAPVLMAREWHNSFRAGLNLNQAALSSNWRGGGVNTIGLNALLNAKAGYRSGKHSWDNEADFLFAFVKNEGQGYRKTQDRLFLDTKYGRAISSQWSLFASLNVLSQFANGYRYVEDGGAERAELVSGALAPTFITAAYGFEYRPNTWFDVRFSPFAPRVTLVGRADRFRPALGDTPYGVRPGRSARWEVLAAQVLAEVDKDVATNVNLKARYLLFANYETLALRTIDHRLDLALTAKVNRYINVALTGIALYDRDQDEKIQYSQGLTLGLLYTLQNYEDEKK